MLRRLEYVPVNDFPSLNELLKLNSRFKWPHVTQKKWHEIKLVFQIGATTLWLVRKSFNLIGRTRHFVGNDLKIFNSFFDLEWKKIFLRKCCPSNWMKKHDVWNGLIRFRKFHVFRHEQTWTIISKTCISRVSRVSNSTTFFIWARQNVIESSIM